MLFFASWLSKLERTRFVLLELFLQLNGFDLVADDADCETTMLNLTAGIPLEPDLIDWSSSFASIRDHTANGRF